MDRIILLISSFLSCLFFIRIKNMKRKGATGNFFTFSKNLGKLFPFSSPILISRKNKKVKKGTLLFSNLYDRMDNSTLPLVLILFYYIKLDFALYPFLTLFFLIIMSGNFIIKSIMIPKDFYQSQVGSLEFKNRAKTVLIHALPSCPYGAGWTITN